MVTLTMEFLSQIISLRYLLKQSTHGNNNSNSTYSATFEFGRNNGKPVLLPDSDYSGILAIYNKVR
jgi:hypothetical protein